MSGGRTNSLYSHHSRVAVGRNAILPVWAVVFGGSSKANSVTSILRLDSESIDGMYHRPVGFRSFVLLSRVSL
jgi:hypothetical protein